MCRRWKCWNWFIKIFPIYSGQSRKHLDASWLEDQAIGNRTGHFTAKLPSLFVSCLHCSDIFSPGTPLHNLFITLVQCISYFPCLLNKDIDKSWWPFGDQEGAINALLRKSLHNYYLLTHDQYYLYPGYSIPYVQNNKWTICINEYGSHVGRVNRYQSQSNCWNRLHVMAICWVNVKYYEIWRLSYVIFTYLLVCEESSQ